MNALSSSYPNSDSSSDWTNDPETQLNDTNVSQERGAKRRRVAVFLRRVPLPLRKGYMISDLVRAVACVMTFICIFQLVYITRLKKGLVRVANDPFDNRFGPEVDRDRSAVWDHHRQSFLRNVLPVPVHSHNDYWRRIPLFEALGSGCISVEADVYLRNSELLVGHSSLDLRSSSTLRSMYLEPLQRMIEAQNVNVPEYEWKGLFNRAPQQTVVLLVDMKTSGPETFSALYTHLQPLRDLDYLTYWNGTDRVMRPLTIVASGNAPFESVMNLNEEHRDIFWDAKLERLISYDDFTVDPPVYIYNRSNCYFASTEFKNAKLWPHNFNVTALSALPDSALVRDLKAPHIEQAHARGLMARFWNTPSHPPNLKEIAWRVLVDLKVDILNMDDLGAVRARAKGWGSIKEWDHQQLEVTL